MSLRKYIYAIIAMSMSACTGNEPSEVTTGDFDAAEDCFNGRLIVRCGDNYGIARSSDSLILAAPSYNQLTFITDELAMGKTDDQWELLDKDGHLVASSIDSTFLADESIALHECFIKEGSAAWDSILDTYEKISEHADRKLLDELKKKVANVHVGMSSGQEERFTSIQRRHNLK